MQKYRRLWFIGALAMVLLTAAGCFQAAGTGPDAVSIAQNTNPTWTPFPSDTPYPTAEPLVVTATQDPNLFVPPTDDLSQLPAVQEFPTQDPNLFLAPTQDTAIGQFPTQDTSFAQVPTLDPNFAQVQSDQNIDPIYVTATYIVARATQTEAYFMTATAGGPIYVPTEQPTFSPLVPTATLEPVAGGSCTYVVAAGENLFRISMKYNLTPQELATANGIPNMNIIMVGQTLTIPNCGSTDTTIPIGATAAPPNGSGTTYTVVQGDTLFNISLKFGVPVTSIANANGISNINLIVVNQQLVIPPA
ncbi:MAG: LysM peptidoglycan-binding domain-containing protein [Chloroflexota bacterium]